MSQTDLSGWLTKREAAAMLGVAEKTLERMSKRGKIQQATRKRPGSPGEVVYHPDEIKQLSADLVKPPEPFVVPAGGALVKAAAAATAAAQNPQGLESMKHVLKEAITEAMTRVRTVERLYHSLDEAAEFTGLPKAELHRRLTAGTLPGIKTGAGWRIRRTDLEKL